MPITQPKTAFTQTFQGGFGQIDPWTGRSTAGNWGAAPKPVTRSSVPGGSPGGSPNYGDISGLFREALAGLTGDTEKMYQSGKRRTMADIAMQSINSGMGNTLNLPAAGIAYDEANRPATNLALGREKAGILTGLGQVGASMYGTNVGAQTNLMQQALQRYIAELNAGTNMAELPYKYPASGGTSAGGTTNNYYGFPPQGTK